MKFNTKYSDKCHATPINHEKPSMTNKLLGFDTDINNIVAGFTRGVPLSIASDSPGKVFMTAEEYQNSVFKLARAKSMFEELPSKLRQRFHNDPKEMLGFLSDSKNDDEAIKLGLKVKPVEVQPIKVDVVTPAVTPDTPTAET